MVKISLATTIAIICSATAHAQTTKDVAGTYTLASESREQNGSKTDLPTQGSLSWDASGRYMLITAQPSLPKIASNNRMTATPEENKAIVSGIVAHYGTYTVVDGNLVFRVERASFPNWDGIEQKRPFTLTGDTLTYTLRTASGGGSVSLVWKRSR